MIAKMTSFGILLLASSVYSFDVTDFSQLEEAKKHSHITIKDLHVPAGVTLDLLGVKPGTTVEFSGTTTFGYKEWVGPLIRVKGKNITVVGDEGNLIDCQGERWWDGKGGNGGKKKPKFFKFHADDSSISDLNIKNLPVHGFSVNSCNRVSLTRINIDSKDGHAKGGHNTDGFDVGDSKDVSITDCKVENQDDCLAINSGEDIIFENNVCIGGHGISIGSVGGRKNNVVRNVLAQHCQVIDSDIGIRIKTVKDAIGSVTNVMYNDIELKNIAKRGIVIQGNYKNSRPEGDPTPGVPIKNLVINNVRGNVLPKGANYHVWVAGASNWAWNENVCITGGKEKLENKGMPAGVIIQ